MTKDAPCKVVDHQKWFGPTPVGLRIQTPAGSMDLVVNKGNTADVVVVEDSWGYTTFVYFNGELTQYYPCTFDGQLLVPLS